MLNIPYLTQVPLHKGDLLKVKRLIKLFYNKTGKSSQAFRPFLMAHSRPLFLYFCLLKELTIIILPEFEPGTS